MFLKGEISHFDALSLFFSRIHADEEEVLSMAQRMQLDPGIRKAIAQLRASGWEVAIASAGCRWYIEYLLEDLLGCVTLHANPGLL